MNLRGHEFIFRDSDGRVFRIDETSSFFMIGVGCSFQNHSHQRNNVSKMSGEAGFQAYFIHF